MTLLLVAILLAVAFVVGYMVRQASELPERSDDIDPEQAMKAAIELHRIRRNLDVARIRSEQRRGGARLRRDIAETLKGQDD